MAKRAKNHPLAASGGAAPSTLFAPATISLSRLGQSPACSQLLVLQDLCVLCFFFLGCSRAFWPICVPWKVLGCGVGDAMGGVGRARLLLPSGALQNRSDNARSREKNEYLQVFTCFCVKAAGFPAGGCSGPRARRVLCCSMQCFSPITPAEEGMLPRASVSPGFGGSLARSRAEMEMVCGVRE